MSTKDRKVSALLGEYAEVNENFRMLTEIRFKLLALLPLGVGAVSTLALGISTRQSSAASDVIVTVICLFGIAVVCALAAYNERNDQIYVWLTMRAARIERELDLPDAAFAQRPSSWFSLKVGRLRLEIGHRTSITFIYSTCISFLLFGAMYSAIQSTHHGDMQAFALIAAVVAIVVPVGGLKLIASQRSRRRDEVEAGIAEALPLLEQGFPRKAKAKTYDQRDESPYGRLVTQCCAIVGDDQSERLKHEIGTRVERYAELSAAEFSQFVPKKCPPFTRAAHFRLALLVDLPPEWLAIVPGKRFGPLPFHRA